MIGSFPGLPKQVSVLVVEDEHRLRELLLDVIPDMGYVAAGARTAEEATRLMDAAPRDIVLLDLNLPGIDGLEFFQVLRKRWPLSQVVVLTGFGDLEAAKKAIHLDVVDFLSKPCPLDKIDLALDRARRRIAERWHRQPAAEVSPVPAPATDEAATLAESERKLILAALARNGGNRTATAVELGISRRTLHYRLAEYQKAGLYTP